MILRSMLGLSTLLGFAPAAVSPPAEAPAEAPVEVAVEPSPEVTAIRAELARGVAGLRFDGSPAPYRAEARMVRADLLSVDGSYGGIITDVFDKQAIGTVEIRVGSAARDNSNYFGTDSGIARVDVALDQSPGYVRKKLWLGLDRAFRGAAQAYSQKRVALQRLAGDEQPPDFTDPPAPFTLVLPPPTRSSSIARASRGWSRR
jgi:hypothetical protein